MFQFLVNAPGPTDQGWWCRTLQWGCDGGSSQMGHNVPEISDPHILGLALIIAILGGLWIGGRR